MKFYHSTTLAAAKAILASGFKDSTGYYRTDRKHTGVWLSDYPLDENDGCKGHTVLLVTGLLDSDISDYEWIEEWQWKPYREWLVPAWMLNGKVTVEKTTVEEALLRATIVDWAEDTA